MFNKCLYFCGLLTQPGSNPQPPDHKAETQPIQLLCQYDGVVWWCSIVPDITMQFLDDIPQIPPKGC